MRSNDRCDSLTYYWFPFLLPRNQSSSQQARLGMDCFGAYRVAAGRIDPDVKFLFIHKFVTVNSPGEAAS
jgi:hypothetical protein